MVKSQETIVSLPTFKTSMSEKKRRVPYGLAGNLIFLNMMEGMRVINVILVSMAW